MKLIEIKSEVPGIGYITAKKQPNGKYKLFYRGSTQHSTVGDKVFDEFYNSPKEGKEHYTIEWLKKTTLPESNNE